MASYSLRISSGPTEVCLFVRLREDLGWRKRERRTLLGQLSACLASVRPWVLSLAPYDETKTKQQQNVNGWKDAESGRCCPEPSPRQPVFSRHFFCFFRGRRQATPSLITPFPVSTQQDKEKGSQQLLSPWNTSYRQDLTTAKFTRPRCSCHLVAICHPAPASSGRGTRVALGTRL